MKRKPPQQVFLDLARKHNLCHEDGEINRSAFYRATNIPVPTVSRILSGDPGWKLSTHTAELLMAAFSVSFEQVMGDKPITNPRVLKPSPREVNLIRALRTLPPEIRSKIEAHIEQSAEVFGKKH